MASQILLPREATCTLARGHARLARALASLPPPASEGPTFVRVEVEVDGVEDPAHWLGHQQTCPRVYFSNQDKSLRVAGVGCAERVCYSGAFDDAQWAEVFCSLSQFAPRARFYGGARFDSDAEQRDEWAPFGGTVFVLPLWELQIGEDGRAFLACNLRWARPPSEANGGRPPTDAAPSWAEAVGRALRAWQTLCPSGEPTPLPAQALPAVLGHEGSATPAEWSAAVGAVLDGIEAGEWSKVVLAQRAKLRLGAAVEPMHLLMRLLEADGANAAAMPSAGGAPAAAAAAGGGAGEVGGGAGGAGGGKRRRHAYLFLLQLDPTTAFMGCTPEKLFKLHGGRLSTEALAGTRPRGETAEADAALARELLHCDKDGREVASVKDFIVSALKPACDAVEASDPFVLQLRHVQHICFPIHATVHPDGGASASAPLRSALAALHPTPAVCGAPSSVARATIRELEQFDRGHYAGPFGYLSTEGCEFCVAIRSALLRGSEAFVYAGAGIVRGSTAAAEWEEVHVKMKNFVALFPCVSALAPARSPFAELPNLNALSSALLVEELLRCGLGHVVMCPGSRCAPLTVAVARSGCAHTLANDERGAGFMALGFARASGRVAAVVVSSGTAVANLLPAVVEASLDHVPLLLLTADRPAELRDTSANQTIQQVGLLGHNLRWFKDMPCPDAESGLAPLLSDAGYALARACNTPCGPVHLNCMMREPLAPTPEDWPRELLGAPRLAGWLQTRSPFTSYLRPYQAPPPLPDGQLLPLLGTIRAARRGAVVAGPLFSASQQLAVTSLAARLGWPLLPDICSGLRSQTARGVAAAAAPAPTLEAAEGSARDPAAPAALVPLFDLLLSEPGLARAARPDVVLQVGGRLVSKRLLQFAASASTAHVLLEEHGERVDPMHSVTCRVQGEVSGVIDRVLAGLEGCPLPANPLLALAAASSQTEEALARWDGDGSAEAVASEPWVARHLCATLVGAPAASAGGGEGGELLFASNSLPIRHLDNFCPTAPAILANRGASGIDGILHTAIGAALGSSERITLFIGDLAMLHDLNALAALSKTAAPLVAVVLNNDGGGIFHQLPIATHPEVFSPYFDTPHGHEFGLACRNFGLGYARASTRGAFAEAFAEARARPGPSVIEVATDREDTHAVMAALRGLAHEVARELAPNLLSGVGVS